MSYPKYRIESKPFLGEIRYFALQKTRFTIDWGPCEYTHGGRHIIAVNYATLKEAQDAIEKFHANYIQQKAKRIDLEKQPLVKMDYVPKGLK